MKNLSSRFAKIRQLIKNERLEYATYALNELQKDIEEKLQSHVRLIQAIQMTDNKNALDDRKLTDAEVLYVDSSTSKLTLSPSGNRCTLKISNKASEQVASDLLKIANFIRKQPTYAVSVRGKFTYHDVYGYQITLYTEDKRNYQPISYKFTQKQLEQLQ